MIFITSIIVLVMIVSQLLLRDALAPFKFAGYLFTYKYANYDINKKNDILEREKKVENDKAIKTYIINKYGEVLSQVIEVEYRGRRKGWHADSEYVLHFPFANDKVVYVESETQKIFTRDYDISTDVKFQHLYSEWVKKQVGIEDENVELKFAGNYDPPYIEFNKITSLSEDYREVFENTHNLYCNRCYVSNIKDLNETNSRIIANDIREKCLFKVIKITKIPNEKISGNIHLSTGAFEKNNDKNFKYRFDLHNFSSELIESDNSHIQER